MKSGLLWYLNKDASLEHSLGAAVPYYSTKYGEAPNTAYLNPVMLLGGIPAVSGLDIKPSNNVLQGHAWLGVERRAPAPSPAAPAPAPAVDLSYVQEQIANGLSRSLAGMPALAAPSVPLLPAHTKTSATLQGSDDYQKHQAHVFRIRAMLDRQIRDAQQKPPRDHVHPDGMVVRVHWFVGPDKVACPALPKVKPMAKSAAAPIPGMPTAAPVPSDAPASISPEQVKAALAGVAQKLHLPTAQERQQEQKARLADQVELVKRMEAERAAAQKSSHQPARDVKDKGWRKGSTVDDIQDAIRKWKDLYGTLPARILVPEFRPASLRGIAVVGKVKLVSDKSAKPGSFRLIAAEVPKQTARVTAQPVRASSGL